MSKFIKGLILLKCLSAILIEIGFAQHGGLGAFVELNQAKSGHSCVTDAMRNRIESRIQSARAKHVGASTSAMLANPILYPFWPQGGTLYQDIFPNGFVDLDATSPGFQDFRCSQFTYDGHRGVDVDIRSFAEQAIGVPVFAVADGVVLDAQDGHPDMNVNGSTNPGNYVIVDVGNGRENWYFHLKNGSVSVAVGAHVTVGQQLGLTASSGNSFGPHLHFEVQANGAAIETHAGNCNQRVSEWDRQEKFNSDMYFMDFGVTEQDLSAAPFFPDAPPRQGQIPFSHQNLYFWANGANLPPNSNYTVEFERPDGSLEYSSGPWPLGNTTWYRRYAFWWNFYVGGMHSIAGTWHLRILFNNQLMVNAPVEVVSSINPSFNRPPEPISVALEPSMLSPGKATFCRVDSDLLLDDLDWDIVRYRYEWLVNGNAIRDNVFAGRADALPAGTYNLGDTIECRVTPNDGQANGATVVAQGIAQQDPWTNLGFSKFYGDRVPHLEGNGSLQSGTNMILNVVDGPAFGQVYLAFGVSPLYLPLLGGTLVPLPFGAPVTLPLDGSGSTSLSFVWPPNVPSGFQMYVQGWFLENFSSGEFSATNGLLGISP